jgi:CRISPR-associated protein Cas2
MKYVVVYDISNDKRRKKLSDLLEKYGFRVNYSVFEIELNKTKFKKLLNEINSNNMIKKSHDSLRFYHICQNCLVKSFEQSDNSNVFQQQELFI